MAIFSTIEATRAAIIKREIPTAAIVYVSPYVVKRLAPTPIAMKVTSRALCTLLLGTIK